MEITYFNAKGATELSRYILAYGEIPYKDTRLSREEWAAKKSDSPLGSLPMLTLENGNKYCQSVAIARYFANKAGLTGKTEEEKLHADMIVDLIRSDIGSLMVKAMFAPDEATKKEILEDTKVKIAGWFEKVDAKYISGNGTVLASGLSWADLVIFNLVSDFFPVFGLELDPKFTKIAKVVETVKNEPKIAAWVEKRPETPH